VERGRATSETTLDDNFRPREIDRVDAADNPPVQPTGKDDATARKRDPEFDLDRDRSALIYCGLCGALNPSSNHYCAACGSTLVDAFHATEGLRVFERPDAASRLVEIVPAGSELDIVEDADAPADYVRVRLPQGKLGYVRLSDVEALAETLTPVSSLGTPNINTNARGCITSTAAIGALALVVVLSTLILILLGQSDVADTGLLGLIFCVTVLPLLLLTVGLYVFSRTREERLEDEAAEAEAEAKAGGQSPSPGES
jgi:hypothetical protein